MVNLLVDVAVNTVRTPQLVTEIQKNPHNILKPYVKTYGFFIHNHCHM